jgi:hypothetical protein
MAGAGYKLFNTGDVLTAAQVNTYLMEQTVMVFADAAARTTALTGVVSEGMISYLKDTNAVEVYNGSAWVASDDPNAIQNTIVDAKGDLITATAADTPARLAVGSNGDTLVADSAASTGLRWQGNYAAGKNYLINGDFRVNQRSFTSVSGTQNTSYGFDRWLNSSFGGGTATYTAQTFTLGSAPVSGYEGRNYIDIATTGQTATNVTTRLDQRIESVRTLANQTATISFWAKAASGTPKAAIELDQQFGTGGSPSTRVTTYAGQVTLSTSWARYSVTVSVPSISGKTIGTDGNDFLALNLWVSAGTDFNARTGSLGIQTNTFSLWGVQVEAGSVATAFQTATGTLQGELAACQRYYIRYASAQLFGKYGLGYAHSTTQASIFLFNPVTMRVKPTSIEFSLLGLTIENTSTTAITALTIIDGSNNQPVNLNATVASGLTTNRPYELSNNASASGYVGLSAEL